MFHRKILLILFLLSGSLHAHWSNNQGDFLKSEALSSGFSRLGFVLTQNKSNILAGVTILGLSAIYLWRNSFSRPIQSNCRKIEEFNQQEDEIEGVVFNSKDVAVRPNPKIQFNLKKFHSDGFESVLINDHPVITYHDSGLNPKYKLQGDSLVIVIKVGHLKK